MLEVIVIIILFCSLIGILVILVRKIPILKQLPETTITRLGLRTKLLEILKIPAIKEKVEISKSSEVYLQKFLSKIRILSLKIENRTANWLQKLRERAKKKNGTKKDEYWQDLKEVTNSKKKE